MGLNPGLGRSRGEGKATYSSILAWRILWTEEPGELQSMGLQKSDTTEATQHALMHAQSSKYEIALILKKEKQYTYLNLKIILFEKTHQWTYLTQGYHKPSICKEKKNQFSAKYNRVK